jgi:CDP-glycerol glycerophosphotransferase (TagB/SpsB family)
MLRLVQWPLRAAARPVVRRMPRDAALAVFGASSQRFADNPAYAFLECASSPSVRCVWISGSGETVARLRALGFEAERRWSWRGIRTAVRAGWFVYGWGVSDINVWLGDGAKTFNLWHGVGVKRIQRARTATGADVFRSPEGSLRARVFADDRRMPDLVLSTSPGMTEVLAEAFGVPAERCVELGYPRNDHLIEGASPPGPLVDQSIHDRLDASFVVGYFPTFRDDSTSIPGGGGLVGAIADVVAAQGGVLLFKAHDASTVPVERSESLVVLPKDADLNAYLGTCDVLVTDYSSAASDFLLTGRPIVLYVPDIDDYDAQRGFALDPRSHLPGVVVRTLDELREVLGCLRELDPPERGDELRRFYWGDARPGASARVAGLLASFARTGA